MNLFSTSALVLLLAATKVVVQGQPDTPPPDEPDGTPPPDDGTPPPNDSDDSGEEGGSSDSSDPECFDWLGLKAAVEADTNTDSNNLTLLELCEGTHNVSQGETIDLSGKHVSISCYTEAGCILAGIEFSAFNVHSTSGATLKGISFNRFGGTDEDAIVVESGGQLKIDQCTFIDNNYALWVDDGGAVVIMDSVFERNGGGGYFGGATITAGGSVTITGCTFTSNRKYNGGALGCHGNGASCTVVDSTFAGNEATDSNGKGGAIYCGHGATCDVSTSAFDSNVAPDGPNIYCVSASNCNLNSLNFTSVTSMSL